MMLSRDANKKRRRAFAMISVARWSKRGVLFAVLCGLSPVAYVAEYDLRAGVTDMSQRIQRVTLMLFRGPCFIDKLLKD